MTTLKLSSRTASSTRWLSPAIKAFEACVHALEETADGVYMPEISGPTIPLPLLPKLGYKMIPLGKNRSYGIAALIFAAIEYKKCLKTRDGE